MTDYNFFAIYEKKKGIQIDRKSPFFWGIIVVVIVILATAGSIARNIIFTAQISTLQAKTQVLKQTEDYAAANQSQTSLDAMVQYDTQADLALQKFKMIQFLDSELIGAVLQKIPTNVRVVSFGVEGYELGITCNAPSRKAATELLLRLKETELFETIYLSSVSYNDEDNVYVVAIDGVLKVGK